MERNLQYKFSSKMNLNFTLGPRSYRFNLNHSPNITFTQFFFVDQAGGLGQSVQAQQQQQQQNYLNFGGHFIQPQQPPQPQALINPASYIGQMAAAAQQAQQAAGQPHQPQIPISSLVATAAAHAASKLPLLRTPTTLYSKVRLFLYIHTFNC